MDTEYEKFKSYWDLIANSFVYYENYCPYMGSNCAARTSNLKITVIKGIATNMEVLYNLYYSGVMKNPKQLEDTKDLNNMLYELVEKNSKDIDGKVGTYLDKIESNAI